MIGFLLHVFAFLRFFGRRRLRCNCVFCQQLLRSFSRRYWWIFVGHPRTLENLYVSISESCMVSRRNTQYFERKTRYQGILPCSCFDSRAISALADLLGFLLHGMPLKYALAATAASQQYLYQAPLAVRRDRNDSKSGLASPNFPSISGIFSHLVCSRGTFFGNNCS